MIVKVQVPLKLTDDEEPMALVYNEDKSIIEALVPLDERIVRLMAGRVRAFFEVTIDDDGEFVFVETLGEQGW